MNPNGLELGIQAAICGLTLGTPLRRSPKYRKVFDYEPVPTRMSAHSALDFWLVLAEWFQWDRSVPWEDYRRTHWSYRSPESAFGERNAALGMTTPLAGAWCNPYAHHSGAMLRVALLGLAGEDGVRLAYADAASDHAGAGLECALATMELVRLVHSGVEVGAAIAQVVPLISDSGVGELAVGANFEVLKIEEFPELASLRCGTRNPDDARLNFLLLCCALRFSGGALDVAWRTLASWGGGCDVTCGLAGLILGPSQPLVVAEWLRPLGSSFVAGSGLRHEKLPETILGFAQAVAILSPSPREGEVAPQSGDGGGHPELPPSPTPSGLPPHGGEDSSSAPHPVRSASQGEVALPHAEGVRVTSLGSSEATPQVGAASDSDPEGVAHPSPSPRSGDGGGHPEVPPSPSASEASPSPGIQEKVASASETDEVDSPSPSPRGGEVRGGGPAEPPLPNPLHQGGEGAFELLSRLLQTPALSQSAGRISTAILSDYKPPERTVEMLIRYSNPSAEKVILQPTCSKPEGWTIASRIPDTSLPPGEALSQALIAKPEPNATHQVIDVQWGSDHLKVPLIAPQLWYTCGPFQNIEMEAFNKPCPCENRLNLKDQFPGRSSVAVRWESKAFRGTIFDVEPWFIGGQGAYVMAAQLRFEPGQRLSVIWAHSPGGELRINNEVIVRYNDQTEPLGGLGTQYAGTFTTTDADTIMIRIMRHKNPCSRMVLYFLDDRGRVVEPKFVPLDS